MQVTKILLYALKRTCSIIFLFYQYMILTQIQCSFIQRMSLLIFRVSMICEKGFLIKTHSPP